MRTFKQITEEELITMKKMTAEMIPDMLEVERNEERDYSIFAYPKKVCAPGKELHAAIYNLQLGVIELICKNYDQAVMQAATMEFSAFGGQETRGYWIRRDNKEILVKLDYCPVSFFTEEERKRVLSKFKWGTDLVYTVVTGEVIHHSEDKAELVTKEVAYLPNKDEALEYIHDFYGIDTSPKADLHEVRRN